MSILDDLWGDETQDPLKKERRATKKGKKATKKERPAVRKSTSAKEVKGFRVKLGTCRRRGKGGIIEETPILLAKDPLCWVLRIGNHQTYPTSLSGVFDTIAQESALTINGDATVEDLVTECRGIEERIKEMGRILDERIRKYIMGKKKKA